MSGQFCWAAMPTSMRASSSRTFFQDLSKNQSRYNRPDDFSRNNFCCTVAHSFPFPFRLHLTGNHPKETTANFLWSSRRTSQPDLGNFSFMVGLISSFAFGRSHLTSKLQDTFAPAK